ncbi:MAG: excinuclease ABC subunit UvrC [Alphaproteobacteria bacterium]
MTTLDAPALPQATTRVAPAEKPDILKGIATIKSYLAVLPTTPGVYRMMRADGTVLYVGKARNLKKRVTAYTAMVKMEQRHLQMVAETKAMEFITTHTEVEALLLEANLIKQYTPRYNVLLRDDKSFPHIMISRHHNFPQLLKHRGARDAKAEYFGPFASGGAVNDTLAALQKAFLLRNCSDAIFDARKRPCLQYQIKRCSAPCVGLIDQAAYASLVEECKAFLMGRSQAVLKEMAEKMQAASEAQDYETAATYRNRIRALSAIQARQDINIRGLGDADVLAVHQAGGQTCIQVFFFRAGSNYGNRAYFPSHDNTVSLPDIVGAFMSQFYADKEPPPLLLSSHHPSESDLLIEALSVRAGKRVEILVPKRGPKKNIVDHAVANARDALGRRLAERTAQRRLLDGIADVFDLDHPPQRIEVYDNSHIQGTHAVGAMIVAGPEGFMKPAYRKFNIRNTQPKGGGDDYGMMREMMRRRFSRAQSEDPERHHGTWPDLVLIDGGKGQLSAVQNILSELGINDLAIVAIAKGPDRNAGREQFFTSSGKIFTLEPRDPVLYFLQRLRDEAHRFAIGAHRSKRGKELGRSELDEIYGIGSLRRRALLHHFGSVRAIARAGLADLEAVEGISRTIAQKIYDHFHSKS